MTESVKIVRVTGAIEEDLDGVGLTTRGEAFDCPKDLAERLLADNTGRWSATAAASPAPRRRGGDA